MSKDLELNFLLRVVDDDPRTLDAVTFMLKCEGYEVTPPLFIARRFLLQRRAFRPGLCHLRY